MTKVSPKTEAVAAMSRSDGSWCGNLIFLLSNATSALIGGFFPAPQPEQELFLIRQCQVAVYHCENRLFVFRQLSGDFLEPVIIGNLYSFRLAHWYGA